MDIQNVTGSLRQAAPADSSTGRVAQRPVSPTPTEQRLTFTPQQLQQAVQAINRKLSASTALEFSVDESTRMTVVKIVDKQSGELIRQIPSDATLAIAESIDTYQKGLLLRQKA